MEVFFAAAGAFLALTWTEVAWRNREVRSHRELCHHVWGEQFEVGRPARFGPGMGARFYAANCLACGETEHRNPDGTKYVPAERRDDDSR